MLLLLVIVQIVLFQRVTSQDVEAQAVSPGTLIWSEEFNSLNYSRWQHLITSWRGGASQFQYYTNSTANRQLIPIIIFNKLLVGNINFN